MDAKAISSMTAKGCLRACYCSTEHGWRLAYCIPVELFIECSILLFSAGETAELAAQALVQHALKLKTNDNVTAIVMLCAWD